MKSFTGFESHPDFCAELCKALCCHERALFFAQDILGKAPPESYTANEVKPRSANKRNAKRKKNASQLIFMDELPGILASTKGDPNTLILLCYADAHKLLLQRLAFVTDEYIYRRRKFWIRIADRRAQAVAASRVILSDRFDRLKQEAAAWPLPFDKDVAGTFTTIKTTWHSLHTMCYLLMDEITHLTKRVDDFYNVEQTTRSFILSLIALVLSAFSALFAFVSLTKDFWWEGGHKYLKNMAAQLSGSQDSTLRPVIENPSIPDAK